MTDNNVNKTKLLSTLRTTNRWWEREAVPSSIKKAQHRRRDFYPVKKRVLESDRQILPLYGPRQVGKTTMSGQLIQHLLSIDTRAEQILYFNVETTSILSNSDNIIDELLQAYQNNILARSFETIDNPIYIFLDEIQKADNWPSTLKFYTDTYDNLRFIITGSISTLIDENARETLVGRLHSYLLLPVKYIEYVRRRDIMDKDLELEASQELRQSLERASKAGSANDFYETVQDVAARLDRYKPQLLNVKQEYLLKGGYPAIMQNAYPDAYGRLNEDLRNTISDIATVANISNEDKLLHVLEMAAYSAGQKINVSNMANYADIERPTAYKYLDSLEDFFLISRTDRYAETPYRAKGKQKIYVADNGILNVLNSTLNEDTLNDNEAMGQIVENACYTLSQRLQWNLSDHQDATVSYWDKKGEVDHVLSGSEYALPIEVKHGASPDKDMTAIKAFTEEHAKSNFGLAVNNADILAVEENVVHLPAWLYFFMI